MPIFNLFSKRQRVARGDVPDVYVYGNIPEELRVQVLHIIREDICRGNERTFAEFIEPIHKVLCREYGKFTLCDCHDPSLDYRRFLLTEPNHEKVLDAIELTFRWYEIEARSRFYHDERQVTGIIEELNERFRWQGVGYQYDSRRIIRMDSQYLHSEAVKPVLSLLRQKPFAGANEEFLTAHEHYRHGRAKECLVECLKAYESVMKAIYDKRKWAYGPGDTAKSLVNVALANGLIPPFMQDYLSGLQKCLEGAVATPRNKLGGHGQGSQPVDVPDHYVAYVLHQTAAVILLLVTADNAME